MTRVCRCAATNTILCPLDRLPIHRNLFQVFNGSGTEDTVFNAAAKILTSPPVVAFLTLPDSFQQGGLDNAMVTCSVLYQATPAGLATFAVNSTAKAKLVTNLLADPILMRDMLVAGGAKAISKVTLDVGTDK